MSYLKPFKRPSIRIWLRLICLCSPLVLTGCSQFILIAYLIGGPPSIEPDFDAQTKLSMTDLDVKVAVVCYAPPELKWDFSKVDKELAKYVSFKLRDHKIKVINPQHVQAWLDNNPDWDKAEEIGAALGVRYVVYIDLHKYSLYERNSSVLYRGMAEAQVSVFEMDDQGEGERIYSKAINSKFPIHAPRSTSDVTESTFRRQYLSRLSEEIGRLFYEYYTGDDIPDAI